MSHEGGEKRRVPGQSAYHEFKLSNTNEHWILTKQLLIDSGLSKLVESFENIDNNPLDRTTLAALLGCKEKQVKYLIDKKINSLLRAGGSQLRLGETQGFSGSNLQGGLKQSSGLWKFYLAVPREKS